MEGKIVNCILYVYECGPVGMRCMYLALLVCLFPLSFWLLLHP